MQFYLSINYVEIHCSSIMQSDVIYYIKAKIDKSSNNSIVQGKLRMSHLQAKHGKHQNAA